MNPKVSQIIDLIKKKKGERAARQKERKERRPREKGPGKPHQKRSPETDPKKETAAGAPLLPVDEKPIPTTSTSFILKELTSDLALPTPLGEHPKENEKDLHQQSLEKLRQDQIKDIPQQEKDGNHQEGKDSHFQEGKDTHTQEGKDLHQQEMKDTHHQEDKNLHLQEQDAHQQEIKDLPQQQGKDAHQQEIKDLPQQQGKDGHQSGGKDPIHQDGKEKDLHKQSIEKASDHHESENDHKDDKSGHKDHEDKDHEDKDTKKYSSSYTQSTTSQISFSTITKQIEAVITDAETPTSQVFNAATTSFFEGYGIAAGHAEDEFGGLGLIGVFEDVASIGTKSSHDPLYLLMTLFLVSWFWFRR